MMVQGFAGRRGKHQERQNRRSGNQIVGYSAHFYPHIRVLRTIQPSTDERRRNTVFGCVPCFEPARPPAAGLRPRSHVN
jgi:hypothetical protein